MAISMITTPTQEDLKLKSHWWGCPDLPDGIDFPALQENDNECEKDLLTFICQIKLEDIALYDLTNQLPHQGMLYFFAALDFFFGDLDAQNGPIGFWLENLYQVVFTSDTDRLHAHQVVWADGTDACLPAESISFKHTKEADYNHKLLGIPYFEEVREESPEYISLLQVDEDDRWGLHFYDCGMLNFLISKADLVARRFDKVRLYFHSL